MMIAYGPAEDAEIALASSSSTAAAVPAQATLWPTSSTPTQPEGGSLTMEEPEADSASDAAVDGQDAPEIVENGDVPVDQPAA